MAKTAKKKKSRISTEEVNESLKCMLTDEEVKQAGENSARMVQEKAVQEADKKSAMAGFTARINAADAGIVAESNKVRDKYEYRQVPCVRSAATTQRRPLRKSERTPTKSSKTGRCLSMN